MILFYIVLTAVVLIFSFGIFRIKKMDLIERHRNMPDEEVVEFWFKHRKLRMTKSQKAGWDMLSRSQKTIFLKGKEADRAKVVEQIIGREHKEVKLKY